MVPFNSMLHRPSFACEYIVEVLKPWIMEHKKFLVEQGFAVDIIAHGVYLADMPCPCNQSESCGELADVVAGDSHGTVLIRDLRSPDSELVKKVFIRQRSKYLEEWSDEEKVTTSDFFKCISFRPFTPLSNSNTMSSVYYAFKFPNQVFGSDTVCCSAALKLRFSAKAEDAVALGDHFRKCYYAMEAIGFPITLDLIRPDNWPDADLVKMLVAAAGDVQNIMNENEHISICFRMDDDRRDRILCLVAEMAIEADGNV